MSTLLGVLAAIYGGSIAIIVAGGAVWLISARLRGATAEKVETD